jgi:membrane-bound ClpP family serine protease
MSLREKTSAFSSWYCILLIIGTVILSWLNALTLISGVLLAVGMAVLLLCVFEFIDRKGQKDAQDANTDETETDE